MYTITTIFYVFYIFITKPVIAAEESIDDIIKSVNEIIINIKFDVTTHLFNRQIPDKQVPH